MYKKLESINTKKAQERFVALQNSVKNSKSPDVTINELVNKEPKRRKIVNNGNEEYFSESSSNSSPSPPKPNKLSSSDLRTFLSEKNAEPSIPMGQRLWKNVDYKSKQQKQGIKRQNFLKKTPPKRRKIVNRNAEQPSSSNQNTSNISSDLRIEKNVNDLELKSTLHQKLEEDNVNLKKKLEEMAQEKLDIVVLSAQKSRDYEKLQADLLATKVNVTTLKFELENSNKLSDILAREKLEIERKEASEKYERETIRSQDLAQNLQILKKELADVQERHKVEKKNLENKLKRENEAEVNKLKSSKNSFNDGFVTLVENIRVSELEKTVKKQKLEIEKKTKENMDLKDSNDGLSNQITIWEESNKNLQDEMSLQKSIFENKSNEVTDLKATINELKNEISVSKIDNIKERKKSEEDFQKLEEIYDAQCREIEKLQSENKCQIADLEVQKSKIQEYECLKIFETKRHNTELKKQIKDNQIKINIWKETGEKEKKEWEIKYENSKKELADALEKHEVEKKHLENELKRVNEAEVNRIKSSKNTSDEVKFWKEKYDASVKELELKESNFKYQCEQYKKVMSNLEEKLATVKEERNSMRNEILDKNQINQELHHQISELKVQFDEMETTKERINKDLKNYIQEKSIKLQDERSKLSEYSKNNDKLLRLIHKKDQELEAKDQELLNKKATCTCSISFEFENVQNVVIKKEIKQEPLDLDYLKAQDSLNKQATNFKP